MYLCAQVCLCALGHYLQDAFVKLTSVPVPSQLWGSSLTLCQQFRLAGCEQELWSWLQTPRNPRVWFILREELPVLRQLKHENKLLQKM